MGKLDDLAAEEAAEAAPSVKRKASPGVLMLLEQVAAGLAKIDALAARVKALEDKPPHAPQVHNHLPKESIRVEVGHPPAAAAPVIHVAPADVHVHEAPEKESRSFIHTVRRNNMGRIEQIVSEVAE